MNPCIYFLNYLLCFHLLHTDYCIFSFFHLQRGSLMASSPGCDQELHHPWFTSSPRASVTSLSHRSSLISCPLSLHVLQSTVFIKCCCDIHLPNLLCPSSEKYYIGHTLNTSSSTFSPSRTSSLLQLQVQMSDEWQRVLFKFTENINSASLTKRCTVWTSL